MTTDDAGAARCGLGQINRVTPGTERHLIADMLGLTAGVGIMAGRADPPFLIINMEIMEVVVPIPETGKGNGPFRAGNIGIVAAKTEIVFMVVITTVKLGRIKAGQQFRVQRPVDIMAGRTVAGLDRPVPVAAPSDNLPELGVTGHA